jgi:hypothetical protein
MITGSADEIETMIESCICQPVKRGRGAKLFRVSDHLDKPAQKIVTESIGEAEDVLNEFDFFVAKKAAVKIKNALYNADPFYKKTTWFYEEKYSSLETLLKSGILSYFMNPFPHLFTDHDFEEVLRNIMRQSRKSAPEYRSRAEQGIKFMNMISDESIIRYSKVAAGFIFFLINYNRKPLEECPMQTVNTSAVEREPSPETISALLYDCVKQSAVVKSERSAFSVFLMCKCVIGKTQLALPTQFSPIAAYLLHFIKCCGLFCVEFAVSLKDDFFKLMYAKDHAGMFVITILGLARSINRSTRALPTIVELNPGLDILVRNKSVQLGDFELVMNKSETACRFLLNQIYDGIKFSIDKDLIKDELNNRTVGVSLLSFNQQFASQFSRLAVVGSAVYRDCLGSGNDIHAVSGLRKLVRLHDDFMEHLLILIHTSSGLPARASELASYTVKNGPSTRRTLMWFKKQIMFLPCYSKSDQLQRMPRNVGRCMDDAGSDLVLHLVLVIRPLLSFIASKIDKDRTIYKDAGDDYLFALSGMEMHAYQIRTSFARSWLHHNGSRLCFRDYRQCCKYMCDFHGVDAGINRDAPESSSGEDDSDD